MHACHIVRMRSCMLHGRVWCMQGLALSLCTPPPRPHVSLGVGCCEAPIISIYGLMKPPRLVRLG